MYLSTKPYFYDVFTVLWLVLQLHGHTEKGVKIEKVLKKDLLLNSSAFVWSIWALCSNLVGLLLQSTKTMLEIES